jgi:integrase
LARFAKADAELRAAGLSIEEAVRLALAHGRAVTRRLSVRELAAEFIESRRARATAGRDLYVRQLEVCLRSFGFHFSDADVAAVTRSEVAAWLVGGGWAATTIKNYAGNVRAMFNWAVREGLAAENPAAGIELPKVASEREVSVLSPEDCGRLLRVCAYERGPVWHPGRLAWEGDAFRFDALLGYVAVILFCGVRPEEVKRSTRADLDLENGTFVVGAAIEKNARRRVVDLSEAALAWLRIWVERHPGQRAFKPLNWRKQWEKLRRSAGLWPWPADVARHTFATMHFALHQNLALLKAQLGHHENEATLHRHYRAVRMPDGKTVSSAVAREFWGLMP